MFSFSGICVHWDSLANYKLPKIMHIYSGYQDVRQGNTGLIRGQIPVCVSFKDIRQGNTGNTGVIRG